MPGPLLGLLPCRYDESQRVAQGVAEPVQFGGQSSTGSPQSMTQCPLFSVVAVWWALTGV